jgi:hypothetical protein
LKAWLRKRRQVAPQEHSLVQDVKMAQKSLVRWVRQLGLVTQCDKTRFNRLRSSRGLKSVIVMGCAVVQPTQTLAGTAA